ncbi:unnamed protein product [Tuber aestivum]|uniref:Uncharacterized protein n=1 Tax=Tuber aestivum TaxID=59557 RepID=A0A292Q9P9_9PEZI|nr:unnamed protein product [Tuber aestivum]
MRTSSILVKLVTLASLAGIVAAVGETVNCALCTACCGSGVQCINNDPMGYSCVPISASAPSTRTSDGTRSSAAPSTTAELPCSRGGQCRSGDLGRSTTEIPRTSCATCRTSPQVPIVTTPASRGNSTSRPTGMTTMPRNSTVPLPTGTSKPANQTTVATGSAGAKTGGAPTGGSGTTGGGAGNTVSPAATSTRSIIGSTGAADRNSASMLAVAVLGSLLMLVNIEN